MRTDRRITRDDLEAAFSEVVGEGEATARDAVPPVLLIAGAVALGVVAIAYLAGRPARKAPVHLPRDQAVLTR